MIGWIGQIIYSYMMFPVKMLIKIERLLPR